MATNLSSASPTCARSTPTNHRKKMPAKGTSASAVFTAFRREESSKPRIVTASAPSGIASRIRMMAAASSTAKTTPASPAARGVCSACPLVLGVAMSTRFLSQGTLGPASSRLCGGATGRRPNGSPPYPSRERGAERELCTGRSYGTLPRPRATAVTGHSCGPTERPRPRSSPCSCCRARGPGSDPGPRHSPSPLFPAARTWASSTPASAGRGRPRCDHRAERLRRGPPLRPVCRCPGARGTSACSLARLT